MLPFHSGAGGCGQFSPLQGCPFGGPSCKAPHNDSGKQGQSLALGPVCHLQVTESHPTGPRASVNPLGKPSTVARDVFTGLGGPQRPASFHQSPHPPLSRTRGQPHPEPSRNALPATELPLRPVTVALCEPQAHACPPGGDGTPSTELSGPPATPSTAPLLLFCFAFGTTHS